MGGCYSCTSSSSSFKNIRVVHLNGYVEDFLQPVSVSQLTGDGYPPKHFVCTTIQLLSSSSKAPLKGETQLQPGHLYFKLPFSILQTDLSPLDLASLAKRLTAIAKTTRSEDNKSLKASPLSSPAWVSSPSGSPGRVGVLEGVRSPYRVRPWKPILDTIREKSLNRRSESDLQENR